ncbi:DEAD/DEAH box helicase [soil metagenome]
MPAPLLAELDTQAITEPFPIQTATLPDTLTGRDVLGRGRTGSGKTLAFSLPLVARLTGSGTPRTPRRPRALVLVPTRELANQVHATLAPLATAVGLRSTTVFGGVGQQPQVNKLRSGVDVLIACPGRLEDLIGQGHCDLGAVEVTVLDEADHMADMGFLPGVKRLLDRTPKRGQRMLFSATLDNGVDVLVRRYLDAPVTHSVDSAAAPQPSLTHHVLEVAVTDKAAVVRELAAGAGRSLLFTRTKHAAKKLARQLSAAGIPAVDLQGNLAQNARERNLAAFTTGEVRVLVATDIAARGVHVDQIELVVHVDPPTEHKAYLHRSGRTARAGAAGVVVTVMTTEQRRDVADLFRRAQIKPVRATVRPGAPEIHSLAGERAPERHRAVTTSGAAALPRQGTPHQPSMRAVEPTRPGRRRSSSGRSRLRRRSGGTRAA